MSEPKVIYTRTRAPSVGNPPTQQVVQRHDGMLNTRRLRNASPLMTMQPHSRRALSKRGWFFFLLVAALVVGVFVMLTTSQPEKAHGLIGPVESPVAVIDPWIPECAPGAACYFTFAPVVVR